MKLMPLFLVLGLSMSASAEPWLTKIPSETGNHCVDQAFGHLRSLFGVQAKFRRVLTDSCSGCSSMIWIRSDLCDGYFVANFNGNASCGVTHYGMVPLYVSRVWAHGGCAKLLPSDSFPSEETTEPYIRRP